MVKMKAKSLLAVMLFLALPANAAQVRVGLVFDFEEGTTVTECVSIGEGEDGYKLMRAADTQVSFSGPFAGLGHSVDCIDGICSQMRGFAYHYWIRYDKPAGSGSWAYSEGSLNGDNEPYNASEGDVMGWVFGSSEYDDSWNVVGATPMQSGHDFCDICGCGGFASAAKRIPKEYDIIILKEDGPEDAPDDDFLFAKEGFTINVLDSVTKSPVWGASIEVFAGTPGITAPLHATKTPRDGNVRMSVSESGSYTLRVSGTGHAHRYLELEVIEPPAQTTTSTSTTTSTVSTTSTTAYEPPKHFLLSSETTTSSTSTSSTAGQEYEKPGVIARAAAPPAQTGGFWAWITGFFGSMCLDGQFVAC